MKKGGNAIDAAIATAAALCVDSYAGYRTFGLNRAAAPTDIVTALAATGVEAAEHIRNRGSLGLAGDRRRSPA